MKTWENDWNIERAATHINMAWPSHHRNDVTGSSEIESRRFLYLSIAMCLRQWKWVTFLLWTKNEQIKTKQTKQTKMKREKKKSQIKPNQANKTSAILQSLPCSSKPKHLFHGNQLLLRACLVKRKKENGKERVGMPLERRIRYQDNAAIA